MQFRNMEIDLSNFQEMQRERQVHTAFLFVLISFIVYTECKLAFDHLCSKLALSEMSIINHNGLLSIIYSSSGINCSIYSTIK